MKMGPVSNNFQKKGVECMKAKLKGWIKMSLNSRRIPENEGIDWNSLWINDY